MGQGSSARLLRCITHSRSPNALKRISTGGGGGNIPIGATSADVDAGIIFSQSRKIRDLDDGRVEVPNPEFSSWICQWEFAMSRKLDICGVGQWSVVGRKCCAFQLRPVG
jgi:hypothetical protein